MLKKNSAVSKILKISASGALEVKSANFDFIVWPRQLSLRLFLLVFILFN